MRIPKQLIVLDAVGTVFAGIGVAGLVTDLSGTASLHGQRSTSPASSPRPDSRS